MKKILIITCALAVLLAQSAMAQITFSASPATQNVAPGATFDVQVSLTITGTTPANVAGYNLWFEISGFDNVFSIVSSTSAVTGWNTPAGFPSGQFLTLTGTTHAGFSQHASSLGYIDSGGGANAIATPITGLLLTTVQMDTNAAAPGTYTFFITNATTSAPRSTGVNDDQGNFFPANTTGSFQITVIPEPATWSFIGLGALVAFGANRLRLKRRI